MPKVPFLNSQYSYGEKCLFIECGQIFAHLSAYLEHVKKHERDNFICYSCDEIFANGTLLEVHVSSPRHRRQTQADQPGKRKKTGAKYFIIYINCSITNFQL